MAGSQQYKNVEIHYVLKAIHMRMPSDWVRLRFEQRFKRKLTENQLRYLKNKYGRDPRFGTPAANSTSTFGAPNPRIGPGYWPTDDILAIDYQAFEERGDDVAEPTLRIVAPINGIVAPTPSPVAPHVPVIRSTGPDGLELAGALSAHTTSATGKKRVRGNDEEEAVDGLTENRLPNLHKTSRLDASASYTDNFARPEYSAAFQNSPPIFGNGIMLSSNGSFTPTPPVGPVPLAHAPLPRPSTFFPGGPVSTYAFGQANQLPMDSFPFTQLNPMGQGVARNMYTGGLNFQEDAYAGVSGVIRQSAPGNMNTIPFCHQNNHCSFNSGFGQHASNDVSIPRLSYQHGPKRVFNSFSQNPAMSNPWEFNSTVVHTTMDLLNSTPSFIEFNNNTPAMGTQIDTPHDGPANHSSFGPAPNMTQHAVSLQTVSSQAHQQISLDGATVPEPDICDRLKTELDKDVLNYTAFSAYRAEMNREYIDSLSSHDAESNSLDFYSHFPPLFQGAFNQSLDTSHPNTNVNVPSATSASSDEVYDTNICDRHRSMTASTVSTGGTSVSQPSEPVHNRKARLDTWLENEHPGDSSTASAAETVLDVFGGLEEK